MRYSLFWLLASNMFEQFIINFPMLSNFIAHKWLSTIIFQAPSPRIKFIILAIKNFPLFNKVGGHIRIIMVPLVDLVCLVVLIVKLTIKHLFSSSGGCPGGWWGTIYLSTLADSVLIGNVTWSKGRSRLIIHVLNSK